MLKYRKCEYNYLTVVWIWSVISWIPEEHCIYTKRLLQVLTHKVWKQLVVHHSVLL